jgi:hypothetical protein
MANNTMVLHPILERNASSSAARAMSGYQMISLVAAGRHGFVIESIFVRKIPSSAIRWSVSLLSVAQERK